MLFRLCIAVTLLCAPATAIAQDRLIIEDVTVIDGTGSKPTPHATIIVEDGRITSVSQKPNRKQRVDTRIISGKGLYALPGLFDVHAHVTFVHDPSTWSGYDQKTTEQVAKILLAFGVTTIRNPAAPSKEAVQLRNDMRDGKVIGPRMLTAGESINIGSNDAADKVRAEVIRQANAGVDYIKVYALMTPELIRVAADEAHKHGLPVIAHLERSTATEAVRAGVDAVTHAASWSSQLLPLDARETFIKRRAQRRDLTYRIAWLDALDLHGAEIAEMIATVAEAGAPLDPTLIAYATKFRGDDPRFRQTPDLKYVPKTVLDSWNGEPSGWTDEDFKEGARVWPKLLQLVKLYYDAGVLLMSGSDIPNPWVIPGVSLHDELELLVNAGIPPLEVIKIATHNGAKGLGILNDVGTLEAGKRGDILLLSADPTADIKNTRAIAQVILAGKVLDRSGLLRDAGISQP